MRSGRSMSDSRNAAYHDAHLDDPDEWDESSAEDVTPRPSGAAVLSLRLPVEEFAQLKRQAEARNTTMSDLTRNALRFYLSPRATGSLSATAIHSLHVTTMTPPWVGGQVEPRADVTIDPPLVTLGNVEPPRLAS